MQYIIESADNGYLISWYDELEDGTPVHHNQVFEIPDTIDTAHEDPQALIDLLYFIKEQIAGQYYSKHKARNVIVKFENGDES